MNATRECSASVKSYRDLIVWKKSVDLVELVYNITGRFPSNERFGLMSQMQRSAVSIPSNIAEGWGRKSTRSYIHFLSIASGSLAELMTQVEISSRLGFCRKEEKGEIDNQGSEISKMLFVLIQKLERNLNTKHTQ